jgi:biopolymer transport protein ExbD
MAGASMGDSGDNPVPLNVTPLIDVIFCLCIFFFCSFHFRQLEGKMESWLPKDRGVQATPVQKVEIEEIRIFLRFNSNAADASEAVSRQIMSQPVTNDDNFRQVLKGLVANYAKQDVNEAPVIIDSDPNVPWKEVVNALSLCRLEGLQKLQFAGPKA